MTDDDMLDDANFEERIAAMKAADTLDVWTARTLHKMSQYQGGFVSRKQSTFISIITSLSTAIAAFLTAKLTIGGS